MPAFDFEILIDDSLASILTDGSLSPIQNKHVLSLVHDFENGKWRYGTFDQFIWDHVAETSLTFQERESLVGRSQSLMIAAARNLRLTDKQDKVGEASELAEILLYAIMRRHFGALPVVPKLFYKQNSQDNAKGADSVHLILKDDGEFSLWLGEAKFYNSIENSRFLAIIDSIGNSLKNDKLRRENSIITNLAELNHYVDEAVASEIKASLSNDRSLDELKPRLHIPILLLHECEITKGCTELTEEYRTAIRSHHQERSVAFFAKQIEKLKDTVFKYADVSFHLILFPVPIKSKVVKNFVGGVEYYKSKADD